jgi:hypothetical protein
MQNISPQSIITDQLHRSFFSLFSSVVPSLPPYTLSFITTMRYSLAVPAFAALAAALPAPQLIDLDMVAAQPNISYTTTASSVTYDVTSIAAQATDDITSISVDLSAIATQSVLTAIEKRAACAAQPTGVSGAYAAPAEPTDDTVSAFASNTAFAAAASSAPIPAGYSNTFTNLNASNNAYGYMGYTTLSSYDTIKCASKCNAINGCMSFNLYFERDPSLEPASACPNPTSTTIIKVNILTTFILLHRY